MHTQRLGTRPHLARQFVLAAIGIALITGYAPAQDQRAKTTTATRVGDALTNIGNAPSPAGMTVRVIGSKEGAASIVDTGLPLNDTRIINALAPGASQSFNSASKFLGTSTLYVKVLVDFFKTVRESNENNNVVDKKL